MPDWTKSMQQTYEYYIVNPDTWGDEEKINVVMSSNIERDSGAETLGSATFNVSESLGECYIRTYLVTIQNGIRERFPLGTHLVQTPSTNFNGSVKDIRLDAYTPLIELRENKPPIGYYTPKKQNVMTNAYMVVRDHLRAPVVEPHHSKTLFNDFVANTDDTWLSYASDLAANADYTIDLDEMGQVIFPPIVKPATLSPVWTFNDDNSSILYPDLSTEEDLYGIPNVVEVIYSGVDEFYHVRVVNNDSNSPVSTVNRGREIVYRETDPSIIGDPTNNQIQEYAERLLSKLSTLERTITYTHGYCPVRVGDCVRLNYKAAGLFDVNAKVISQSIECVPGCRVTETASYPIKLWR